MEFMEKAKEAADKLIKLHAESFYELEELRIALTKEKKQFISKSAVVKVLLENYKAMRA